MQKKQLQNCQEQKQNENHKPNIWGREERKTNFLCATFRRKTKQNKGEN